MTRSLTLLVLFAALGCRRPPHAPMETVDAGTTLAPAAPLKGVELVGARWTANGDVVVVTPRDVVRLWPRDIARKPLLLHMRYSVRSFATASREDVTVIGLEDGALYVLRDDHMQHLGDVDIAHEVELSEDGFIAAVQGISETWFFDVKRGELRGRKRPRSLRLSPSGRWAMGLREADDVAGVWRTDGDLEPGLVEIGRATPLAWIGERAVFAKDDGMVVVDPETRRHSRVPIPCTGTDASDPFLRRVIRVCAGRVYFVGIDPLTRATAEYPTPAPPFEWSPISFSARGPSVQFSVVSRTDVARWSARPDAPTALPSLGEETYRDGSGRVLGYYYPTAEDPFPAPGLLAHDLYVRRDDVRVVPRGSDRVITRVGADTALFDRRDVP